MVLNYEDLREGRIDPNRLTNETDYAIFSWYHNRNIYAIGISGLDKTEAERLWKEYKSQGWQANVELDTDGSLVLIIQKSFLDVSDGETVH